MINLHESMGPGRDRTRDPWICSQTRICSQTLCQLRYAALGQGLGDIKPGPKFIKPFSCSTKLRMNFVMLIHVKRPTIVGILTFISMINTTSSKLKLKARNVFICRYYNEISCSVELSMKKVVRPSILSICLHLCISPTNS